MAVIVHISVELRIGERQAQKFGENCMQACRVQGLGFRVYGLGFRSKPVEGRAKPNIPRLRVYGLGELAPSYRRLNIV